MKIKKGQVVIIASIILLSLLGIKSEWDKLESSESLPNPGQLTAAISQGWLGDIMSKSGLDQTYLGKTALELFGTTWAPIILIAAAILVIAAVIWLIRKGEGAIIVVVIMLLLSWGAWILIDNYIERKTGVSKNLNWETVPVGGTVVDTMLPATVLAIRLSPANVKQYGYVYKFACPVPQTNIDDIMFETLTDRGANPFHVALTEESQKLLPPGTRLEVRWTITVDKGNPCRYLKIHWLDK